MNDERKRGRKSGASLEVVVPVTGEPARPGAPDDLTSEQAEIWRAVVQAMPADWFGAETHGLLAQYCRHAVSAREVDRLIDEHQVVDPKDPGIMLYNRLLIMRSRESAALIRLGRAMRLSQQARIDPKTAGRRVSAVPTTRPPHEL